MLESAANAYASHHYKDLVALATWVDDEKVVIISRGEKSLKLSKDQVSGGLGKLARLAIETAQDLNADAVDMAHLINLASTTLYWMPARPSQIAAQA